MRISCCITLIEMRCSKFQIRQSCLYISQGSNTIKSDILCRENQTLKHMQRNDVHQHKLIVGDAKLLPRKYYLPMELQSYNAWSQDRYNRFRRIRAKSLFNNIDILSTTTALFSADVRSACSESLHARLTSRDIREGAIANARDFG